MTILARVTNVLQNRQSRLKGYELGRFLLVKLDYKITGAAQASLSKGDGNTVDSSAMILGGGRFETPKVTKVFNGATPILMFKTCQGELTKKLEVQLVETFATCRFAHYLKCKVWDKLRGSMTRSSMQAWLNNRINRYVEPNPNDASEAAKAMRPLAAAEVVADEDEINPGDYSSDFFPQAALPTRRLGRIAATGFQAAVRQNFCVVFRTADGCPLAVPHFFTCYRALS